MKIVEPGHIYALQTKEGKEQLLTFVKTLPELGMNHDGVLCQEVLRALIDRVIYLNIQVPCHENIEIINNLRESLILFEQRAFRRTLEKCYSKVEQHVEQLSVKSNGHFYDLKG